MRILHTFQVQGTYPFPTDMLRYDNCWPASSEDAAKIENLALRFRVVTLQSWQPKGWTPTWGRWQFLGWREAE